MKTALSNCEKLNKGFDREWLKKVQQLQIPLFSPPLFSPDTKGAWVLCFDDILADALESGPLRDNEIELYNKVYESIFFILLFE